MYVYICIYIHTINVEGLYRLVKNSRNHRINTIDNCSNILRVQANKKEWGRYYLHFVVLLENRFTTSFACFVIDGIPN
jgi:hypothetical protein